MMKNKKSVIISCIVGILLLAICGVVLFSMPVIKYNNGNNAIKNGDYELAIEIFTGLDGYKDSYQKIKEARYCLAKDKLESDDIVSGIHMLQNLGEYKDSKQLIVEYTPLLNIIKMKDAQKGDTVVLGKCEQDNDLSNGEESIEWRVLERTDNGALLVSEKCLAYKQYNTESVSITWETCTLREYLNNEFFNEVFSVEEQKIIKDTYVINSPNKDYGTSGGNDTIDKIFILSYDEAINYFESNMDRSAWDTPYAASTIGSIEAESSWWLRTPGSESRCAIYVGYNGSIWQTSLLNISNLVENKDGVRPAMWVNVK